jgi:hypothetical protein
MKNPMLARSQFNHHMFLCGAGYAQETPQNDDEKTKTCRLQWHWHFKC